MTSARDCPTPEANQYRVPLSGLRLAGRRPSSFVLGGCGASESARAQSAWSLSRTAAAAAAYDLRSLSSCDGGVHPVGRWDPVRRWAPSKRLDPPRRTVGFLQTVGSIQSDSGFLQTVGSIQTVGPPRRTVGSIQTVGSI